jgi:hypothetical protein
MAHFHRHRYFPAKLSIYLYPLDTNHSLKTIEMMRTSLLFSFLLLALAGFGQKKVIDPGVYNDWNRIGDIQLSPDGKYSAYTIRPFRGDGYLFIVNN